MQPREIRMMPDWLKNQIAAGEVIERPASVVKELAENSLDAGATELHIEIEDGGLALIRVVDNGWGMGPADARLAMQRHATSKLYTPEELQGISTLGFRGEALPSIAAVSRFTLITRTAGELAGTRIDAEGGLGWREREASCPPGTQVEVRELFFNTPARRKFLKTPASEAAKIVEYLEDLAIGHPGVRLTFVNNSKKVLDVPAGSDELGRLWNVLGQQVCNNLYECVLEGRLAVGGFVSRPDFTRNTRASIHLFVNGRPVKDRVMMQALLAAYGPRLPKGRFPVAILNLSVPPALVDVNVHPSKSEVRFASSQDVFVAINRAVALTLDDAPWAQAAGPAPATRPRHDQGSAADLLAAESGHLFALPALSDRRPSVQPGAAVMEPSVPMAPATDGQPRYLGTLGTCYLLFDSGAGLLLVDQHAAHEGLLFKEYLERAQGQRPPSQKLLLPMVLHFSPAEAATLLSHTEFLQRLGYQIEGFGGGSVMLLAVPEEMTRGDATGLLLAAAQDLATGGGDFSDTASAATRKVLATMACKAALKAGTLLPAHEAQALLDQLGNKGVSTCPHGRPVLQRLSLEQIDRWFKR